MHEEAIGGWVASLFAWAKEHDFAGHDPHDLLNAPLLGRVRSPLGRLIAVQLGRRSAIDLRTLLHVPKSENPKALALFLSGLLQGKDAVTPDWLPEAAQFGERLISIMQQSGGWGYPFPWQSRTHFVPRDTPNIVTTAFAGNALIALHSISELSGLAPGIHSQCKIAIESACDYILRDIPRVESSDGLAFGYSKDSSQIVFNASLLGAEFLLNAGSLLGREEYRDIARNAARFVMKHQRDDGSWQYGLERSQTWTDSFHTGFLIVSLKTIADKLGDSEIAASAQRGFDYYRNTFIEPDYAVKYYHDRRYPIDAHALGQAMVTLCAFGERNTAERVAAWAGEHMRSPQGYFYYQRHRLFTNRIAYMRWSNAWMFRGLSEVAHALQSRESPILRPKIWIDLENTPHVPFFIPIVLDLEKNGCEVILTARDFAQTKELIEEAGLNAKIIGREYGNSNVFKSIGIILRAIQLAWYMRGRGVSLAVGHGSRGQLLAARMLRIPLLTLYDYEGASVSLFHRLATWVMTPEIIPFSTLERLGLKREKHLTYPGLKEEVYVSAFEPNEGIIAELPLDPKKIIITIRPPSRTAHYRSDESFVLFRRIMELLCDRNEVQIILMPRNQNQRKEMEKDWGNAGNVTIPSQAVDGLNLLYQSDLVIGGGGTMNREAAVLEVPVISIFKGPRGAVDSWLIEQGKMREISSAEEIVPYIVKRFPGSVIAHNNTREAIVEVIFNLARLAAIIPKGN
jgi:predicted glycosyltransferase